MARDPRVTVDGDPVEYLDMPTSPVQKRDMHVARIKARGLTLGCSACGLRDGCNRPVPPTFPTTSNRALFAVVGEAPGQLEDRKGQVFVGRSGQLLRKLMRAEGIDVDAGAWMNVNACRPPDNRTPEADERAACRDNLLRGLRAANTRYVLLCGATAVNAWRTGVKVTKIRGRWFIWADEDETGGRTGWWVLPTIHPAAPLRKPGLKHQLREDLAEFAGVLRGELKPWYRVNAQCVECGEGVLEHWDHDGAGWCAKCWGKKTKQMKRKQDRGEQGQLHL